MSSISINSNLSSLRTQRQLAAATGELTTSFSRLSSGLRITRASDDAAGLAIATSLDTDKRVYAQGIRNFNDGISITNIAEGALSELSNIAVRIRELAEQAANGTFSAKQRLALDQEAQNLSKEFTRIVRTTRFNNNGLLSGELQNITLQGGYGASGQITANVGGAIGDGTFGPITSYLAEGAVTVHVVTADFNGDGNLDLASTGVEPGNNSYSTVRLGNGDGTFGAAVSYAAGTTGTGWISATDVNNDGLFDLATVEFNGRATIRLGRGDGTFGAQVSYQMDTTSSNYLTTADLNSDGIIDLVTTGASGGSSTATIRLGNGDGTFKSSLSYTQNTGGVNGVSIGDINGDSIVDMVTGGTSGTGNYVVRLGLGNGTFGSSATYAVAGSINAGKANLVDVNADGNLDIVGASTFAGLGAVQVLLNRGDGTFGAPTSYSSTINFMDNIATADLNGDGLPDLMSTGDNGSYSTAIFGVRLNRGDGTFDAIATYLMSSAGYGYSVNTGDINNDGVTDALLALQVAGSSKILTLFGNTVSGTSPILPFSLRTAADAKQALAPLTRKVAQIAAQRGTIGAYQGRFSSAIATLGATTENYAAAASQIMDADVAVEAAKVARLNILQQAASAVLAQANKEPAIALKLLGDI